MAHDQTEEPPALDRPLPVELTGSGHGWFTNYRTFPVCSPRWARGRLRLWGVGVAVGFLLVLGAVALSPGPDRPYAAMLNMLVQTMVPIVLGPWLASRVRLRGWAAAREFKALCVVFLATVLLMQGFNAWVSEPFKQWVSERIGAVDADGKRRKVHVELGISIRSPDRATPPAVDAASAQNPAHSGSEAAAVQAVNLASSALFTFWLAGGLALWRWRRERNGLLALRRERELAQAQAERREAELRLSVLAAQVEPHFLFNTLAGVRSAIATDPGRASEMIDRLVDYLRASIPRLRNDGSAQATLGGQFEIVRAYLGLMAARLPRLQVRVQAPPELLATRCPPWMLVSLAENAVRHGIEPKPGSACIEVSARRREDGGVDITVADDGVGFGHSESGSGLGLANIRERLQQLYRGRAALSLKARPEGGVTATISLPPEAEAAAP